MRNAAYVAHLACGHDAPTQDEPAVGGWLSCITRGCRRQERIVAVSRMRPEPVPLWEPGELAA